MADALRGSMDAAEYKHVVLGLIFLKYISDAFEERHARLLAEEAKGADPEDPDEHRGQNIFWVPPEARWTHLKAQAKQSTIGKLVDDAMAGIERDNSGLKGVLPKDYARPALDKSVLGRVYEPCCGSSGMFVQWVEFIRAHSSGNGNGGKPAKGAKPDISIYGQESNYTTWRLAEINLAIRGIDGQIAHGDTFHADPPPRPRGRLHPRQPASG
jgi:type I restriction enzyme M protein